MTALAKVIFVHGMGLVLVAPLLLRRRWASPALAGGASIVLVVTAFGLAHIDRRYGPSANQSDRRYYLLFLALELSVLALALISWRRFKWTFWLGWGINLALALYLAVILIWLEFFWHWQYAFCPIARFLHAFADLWSLTSGPPERYKASELLAALNGNSPQA